MYVSIEFMVNYVKKHKVYVQPGKIESKRKTSTAKKVMKRRLLSIIQLLFKVDYSMS